MKARQFALTKESIAASRTAATQAVASAQVADIALARAANSGRDGEDAARRAALVSLGKKSVMYRFGNAQNERSGAIEELVPILRADLRGVALPVHLLDVIAGAALQELTDDRCFTCFGRGLVPDHSVEGREGKQPMRICDKCNGMLRRKFDEDARIKGLAQQYVARSKLRIESHAELDSLVAAADKQIRKSRQLRPLLNAVDFAKGVLLSAERAAVEGAAKALGKAME